MIELTVDLRERDTPKRSGLASILDYLKVPHSVALLDSGDATIITEELSLGAERKEIRNFLTSINTVNEETGESQLYYQLRKLSERYDIAVLILEGIKAPTQDGFLKVYGNVSGWRYESFEGILFNIRLKGILVIETSSLLATGYVIKTIYNQLSSGEGEHSFIKKKVFAFSPKQGVGLRIIQSLPGVGIELSERLLDHFDRIPLRIANANLEELKEVRLIGEKKAKAIYMAFREKC